MPTEVIPLTIKVDTYLLINVSNALQLLPGKCEEDV